MLLMSTKVLLSAVLGSVVALASAHPQAAQENAKPAATASPKKPTLPARYRRNQQAESALRFYSTIWGVDSLSVKSAESGEMIRFTYRVLDPEKAKVLNDKQNEPFLIDPKAGVKLVVPEMDKVGKLRQSSTPIAGKVYWMAFSNKGEYVKPGDRVDVVIGQFRVEGLVVR